MTKMKNLVWRLSKLPSADELRELVKDKIITQEEARQILFKTEEVEDRDAESLKEEIKFLRELVEKLSNRSGIVEVIKEIRTPYVVRPWYTPYAVWSNENSTYLSSGGSFSNASGYSSVSNFIDIDTF